MAEDADSGKKSGLIPFAIPIAAAAAGSGLTFGGFAITEQTRPADVKEALEAHGDLFGERLQLIEDTLWTIDQNAKDRELNRRLREIELSLAKSLNECN